MTGLDDYIARSMEKLPIEADIIKRVVNALNKAHDPITDIFDGAESNVVEAGNLADINRIVFNLDECFLNTASGGWVRIVLGNEWDCLVDYTLGLEDAIAPVNAYIEKHW